MTQGEKKRLFKIPVKLILTEEGSTFFIKKQKKLLRFTLAGNSEEYGISLEHFLPETLQRLILSNYISKVEIAKTDMLSIRQEIMDLSKLIIYSSLYRQYDSFLLKEIIQSPAVKKWNRLNPAGIIDEKTKINEHFVIKILKRYEDTIEKVKREILRPLYNFINSSTLRPEEKNIQFLLSEKFLNNLRPFIWFLIIKFQSSGDFEYIIRIIRTSLTVYMDKTKLAEYISLMLMELILSAENLNMRAEMQSLYPKIKNQQEGLLNQKIRGSLISQLEKNDEKVFVSWKIGGGSNISIGTQGKIQISLYNRDKSSEEVKEHLNNMKKTDVNKHSLIDFYKALPEGNDVCNLGMYYISYLIAECEKVNVHFESNATRIGNDVTVVNLVFAF